MTRRPARHRPFFKLLTPCRQASRAWQELVVAVADAERQPGYTGPRLADVQRIAADIVSTEAAIASWWTAPVLRLTRELREGDSE